MVEGLKFQSQCSPLIVSKVKGLLQKHPDELPQRIPTGLWVLHVRVFLRLLSKPSTQLSPPNLFPKAPGFLHSLGVVFVHLFIHFHLFMFPL